MSKEGSVPRAALPAWLAPVVVLLGVVAMPAGTLFRPMDFRFIYIVSELMLPLPALVALAALRVPVAGSLALRRLDARTTGLSLLAGAAFWAASLGLMELQYTLWRPPHAFLEAFRRLHDALRPSGPLDALASLAAIALAPAFFEEILFRGIVLPSLLRGVGNYSAIAVSALLFGFIHLDFVTPGAMFYRVPFAFVVGLGLGLLRVRSGSLLPPILAHALLNTITFLVAPFTEEPAGGLPEPQPLMGTALLVVGLAASAWMLRRIDSPARSS
jgi:membrane protease YdiL (CAAX protease family)